MKHNLLSLSSFSLFSLSSRQSRHAPLLFFFFFFLFLDFFLFLFFLPEGERKKEREMKREYKTRGGEEIEKEMKFHEKRTFRDFSRLGFPN